MPSLAQLAFEDVSGGMNAADPPHKIATTQVARMTNCVIQDGLPTTRYGTRVVSLSGDGSEWVARRNFQGSIFYNPAKGQGGIVLSKDNASLAAAFGGHKLLVTFPRAAEGVVRDITGGFTGAEKCHLNWLSQWEDMLVATDGLSPTFIYQPDAGASYSRGYNTIEKNKSQIPNGATVLAYAHARGVAVVNSRFALVGDSLHRTDQSSSANLKDFQEQVYWATGQYFLPPSAIGGITAAAVLPLADTAHGHGDLILHCEDGIFSLDINQYPRSNWSQLQLTRHVALQAGATGPYAIAGRDRDQLYRTRAGAQSLRSAHASADREGAPESLLSPEVDTWFSGDYGRWLRFASVSVFAKMKHAVYSTAPIVQGRHRWHRGLIARNLNPLYTAAKPAVWEGLWTFPPETRGIIQTVGGLFDGRERQFAWAHGADGLNRLLEFDPTLRFDVLADGTRRPIRSQVITRAIDAGKWWIKREFTLGTLFLRRIIGLVRWGVWYRTAESPAWIEWRQGRVDNPQVGLADVLPRALPIELGNLPAECQTGSSSKSNISRSIQFLVRWEGYCQLEGLRIDHGENEQSQREFKKSGLSVTMPAATGNEYDDFEYSASDESTWITT